MTDRSDRGVPRPTRREALAGSGALLLALAGCGGDIALVPVAEKPIDPEAIDRDPLALLPSKAIVLAGCDVRALYSTALGNDVTQIVREIVPLGPESGFEPSRDVDRITAGVYAMQGADIAAVVQGRFDPEAIGKAADAKQTMPSGKTIVKTTYAGQTMYTVGNLGFVVLTKKTMLSGNEIGMRRALDRLRYHAGEAPLTRAIDGWMLETIESKSHLALAGDFESSSIGEATTQAVPLVVGLKRAKIQGNFQSPGLALSGTLAYKDETSADQSAASMKNLTDVGLLGSLFASVALGAAIPQIDARRTGTDLAVSTTIDEPTSRFLLKYLADAAKAQL
jgi:hypothetical protein